MRAIMVGLLAAVVAGFVVPAPAAQAAPSTWSVTATANESGRQNVLYGASCISATTCFAAGLSYNQDGSGFTHGLVQRWNGTAWSWSATLTDPTHAIELRAISCATTTFCVAVGGRYAPTGQPYFAHFDGSTWTAVPGPTIEGGGLLGVDCVSPTMCIAVGNGVTQGVIGPLAERWDGQHWTVMPTDTLGATSSLNAVSCASADDCTAVGSNGVASGLVAHFDGATWASIPVPHTSYYDTLYGVACPAADACIAVGVSSPSGNGPPPATIAMRWDGTQWQMTPTGTPGGSLFQGVSCASATECVAVGIRGGNPAGPDVLLRRWDGTAWTSIAVSGAASSEVLLGIACPSAGSCVGVGNQTSDTGTMSTLAVVGTSPPAARVVSVTWSAAEAARLEQVASWLGMRPAELQRESVWFVTFLVNLGSPAPTPASVPTAGNAVTYTNTWDATDVGALDGVKAKFVLSDADATRFSVYFVEFLAALGGH